MQIYLVNAEKI